VREKFTTNIKENFEKMNYLPSLACVVQAPLKDEKKRA
jgi:hypothetical protein